MNIQTTGRTGFRSKLFPALLLLALVSTGCGRYLTAAAAVVDGRTIPMSELDRRVSGSQPPGEAPSSEQRLESERRELGQMIQDRIIQKEARDRKIKVPKAEVESRFEQIRSQFKTEQEFASALAQQGVTVATARERIRLRLIVEEIQKSLAGSVKVSDRDVRESYGRGESLQTANVRHILFSVPDPAKEAEVRRKAQAVLNQLRAGADFATLAKKYSEDTGSKEKGGALGSLTRGRTVPEFERIAFALKAGQISNLVRSQFGFHIIQTLEIRKPTLKEAAPEIKQRLQQERAQASFSTYLTNRVRVASVRVNPRFGVFNAKTLQVEPKQFFTPANPKKPEGGIPGLELPGVADAPAG